MKLFAALGNPGSKYANTKHNIAWMAVDKLLPSANWKSKFKGEYVEEKDAQGEPSYFLKPQTYMNLSGESVQPLMNFFKINPENLIVIHDELDLPFGTASIKWGGGLAGHNGLKSIAQMLGTQDFFRLRLGISRPENGQDVSSWVLSSFGKDNEIQLDQYLKGAAEIIKEMLNDDIKKVQNKYNKKSLIS